MKSVFEEAASVAKAIEKGWIKAGQPQKFSVTILEKPEKNFIGMVKKSAKVGVFFEDRKESDTRRYQPQRGQRRPQGRVQLPQQRGGERRSGYQQRSSSRPQQQGRPPQRDPQSQPYPDKRKPVASVHQPPQPTQETRPTEKKERHYPRIQSPRKSSDQYRAYERGDQKQKHDGDKKEPIVHKDKPENK